MALKKRILSFVSFFFVLAPYYAALAQAKCTVNGREVPCEDAFKTLKTGVGVGIGLVLVFLVLGIAAFIFWIVMLVHAIKNQIENKPTWIIVLLLFGIIGAIIYYFSVKRKFGKIPLPVAPLPPSPQQ